MSQHNPVGWTTEADETMTLLAALVLVLCYAHAECLSMVASRRAVVVSALAAWPLDARSAEPEPIPVCDAECMAARKLAWTHLGYPLTHSVAH